MSLFIPENIQISGGIDSMHRNLCMYIAVGSKEL
jgi:hypothetical protein